MEIEDEKNNSKENNQNTQESQNPGAIPNLNIQYLSQILGIKITQDELSFFNNIEDLTSFINSIKFPEKKKNETKDTLIEELKFLKSEETLQKYKEEKNKKFSEYVKLNGKTTVYLTAEKDELSPTMHAFYFCDKSKQILSDKDAAEFKNMNFDPVYPRPFLKDNEDNSSYNSLFIESQTHSHIKNLNRKRKLSNSLNNQKSSKKKKIEKNNAEYINNNNNNNNNKNGDDLQDIDYCIPKCKYGRKSRGLEMILCDKCENWYHTKCLEISPETVKKIGENVWFCPKCEKSDAESKKDSEEAN